MDRYNAEVNWSEEQCNRVSKVVQAEAQKARVAAQFLPTNPVSDVTAVAVPNRTLQLKDSTVKPPEKFLSVDNMPNTVLTTFAVNIKLTAQEMADPEQASALIQFRRAANIIARLEDALIFRGQSEAGATPPGVDGLPPVFTVNAGTKQPGLHSQPGEGGYGDRLVVDINPGGEHPGNALAGKIIAAVGELENAGQNRPFALVLGQKAFANLHDPTAAMILPRDRVVPFLEGPLLRSSTLPPDSGVLVALGGAPPEVVVSSELHVRFLQITTDPYFVFRISERIALRVTDWKSIVVFNPKKPA
jgi:uncharacterized linocin/CFP29 family protein